MPNRKQLPSQEQLLKEFRYNKKTGILVRRETGLPAGTVTGKLYICVSVNGTIYKAHRLIWKIVTGNDPGDNIDHEDGNKKNNRWRNLRDTTWEKNRINVSMVSENSATGYNGIEALPRGRYRVRFVRHGKKVSLGCFPSLDKAVAQIEHYKRLHGEIIR